MLLLAVKPPYLRPRQEQPQEGYTGANGSRCGGREGRGPDRGRVIRLGFLGQANALNDLQRQARLEERMREREEERERELLGDDADS